MHLASCLTGAQEVSVEHGQTSDHDKRAQQARDNGDLSGVKSCSSRVLQSVADKH